MQPISLVPNDKIAIVAPSGRVFPNELNDGIQLIENWNFRAVKSKHLFEDFYFGYHYAGSVNQRTEDFQNALDDENIRAIWFARGGYGAVHILDKINWDKFLEKPKWLIGYSDITAIHNHVNNLGIKTLHALTVKRLDTVYTPESFESIRTVLKGEKLKYEIEPHFLNCPGKAKGKLVGGNLSLIYSLIGSKSEIKGENLILFIEDWCENWYHLDRMLTNLERSGLTKRISALIAGSFTRMDLAEENPEFLSEYDSLSYKIIHNFIKKTNIPVCFGFPAGHIGDNRSLILGAEIEIVIQPNGVKIEF